MTHADWSFLTSIKVGSSFMTANKLPAKCVWTSFPPPPAGTNWSLKDALAA